MENASNTPVESGASAAPTKTKWKPLRIWPAVVLLLGMITCRVLPAIVEDVTPTLGMLAVFGLAIGGLLILIWWIAASRATAAERIVGFLGVLVAGGLAISVMDKSMFGPAIMVLFIPLGTACFGLGATICHRMLSFKRTIVALLFACIGFGVPTLLRSDGMWGNFTLALHPRWVPSPEDALLKRTESSRRSAEVANDKFAEALAKPDWPEFRGLNRDGVAHGPVIASDWNTNPPKQVWKVAIGPGWSSFAVAGPMLFTQEQRGSFETIVCYAADTGAEIWTRQVEARFDDPMGGPGPRATPSIADGSLYVLGAKGDLMKLDPKSGEQLWHQDLTKVADRKPPAWGFCSSPLVTDSVVVVHAGGNGDKGILAFSTDDGKLQWSAASGDHSYCSPQISMLNDERVLLMLTNAGLNILDPATGALRLNYEWPFGGYRALQPQVVDGDSVILATPMATPTRRVRISKTESQLKAEEVWNSGNLKPDFNDLVVFKGNAYGYDAAIFTCIDLKTGQRLWKGGRYGKGQVLLQEESGVLIVMGEQGEVVLLKADPKELTELGRIQAITGKTWNHPVLVGDRLYIRNSQEAACYQVPLAAQ